MPLGHSQTTLHLSDPSSLFRATGLYGPGVRTSGQRNGGQRSTPPDPHGITSLFGGLGGLAASLPPAAAVYFPLNLVTNLFGEARATSRENPAPAPQASIPLLACLAELSG